MFRLIASQAGEDAGVPYTDSPGPLAQDESGFIWIGTEVGLQRWDGYHIRNYSARAGDACALPAAYVVALYADSHARLWISTFGGGLAYYEPATDCIRSVAGVANELAHAPVVSFASDTAGGLWLGTTAGLVHLEADLTHVTRLREDVSALGDLSHDRITCVVRDRHGVLWVGSGRGLQRRALTAKRFESVALPTGVKVRALLEGSDGRIWVGTVADGAFVVDPLTAKVQAIDDIARHKPIPLIWRVAETATGEIWFGTTNSGIVRVDPASLQVRPLRHQKGVGASLPDDEVVDLMRDRSGLLWTASATGFGFFNLRDDISAILSDNRLNGFEDGPVKAMVRLGDGRLAIVAGTELALIGPRGTGAERVPLDPLPKQATFAALATLNGRDLFAFVQPYGLVWIDRTAKRSMVVPLPGPDSSLRVLALLPDADSLWVAGIEGLWLVEHRTDRALPMPWQVSRRSDLRDVMSMAMGTGDTRWAGTVAGLYRFSKSSPQPTHIQLVSLAGESIADPHVRSLHTDHQGRLWIGSNSEGVFVSEPSTKTDQVRILQHLSAELPSGAVNSILEDAYGAIWVSTDRGIARIDAKSFTVSRLARGDGIGISSYVTGNCADEACNELMFGGLNGITVIRPGRQVQTRVPAPVVITHISIGQGEVPSARFNDRTSTQVLDVPAGTRSLAVEFAALDYSDPMRNRYEYQLEGVDAGWVPTRFDTRMAMYMSLAPGTYRLRLRGSDHSGVWSPRERGLILRVGAAWYQTMWFHLLELLGVLLGIFAIVQARTALLRARERELESLVEDRTKALVRATEERGTLIENLAHDLRTPITSLRSYLETLTLKGVTLTDVDRSRFVGIAVRQVKRLDRLVRELFELVRLDDAGARLSLEHFSPIELMQDVVQEFASIADGRVIKFEPDPGVEAVRLCGDINLIQRMIENLIHNALNHTPQGGAIAASVAHRQNCIVLEVRDTGRGIEASDLERIFNRYERGDTAVFGTGYGLGLAIVKRIVELHSGTIAVASQVGVGTIFTVRLPVAGPTSADRNP